MPDREREALLDGVVCGSRVAGDGGRDPQERRAPAAVDALDRLEGGVGSGRVDGARRSSQHMIDARAARFVYRRRNIGV
jgi:hypothetical protein